MQIYTIQKKTSIHTATYRIGPLHSSVFHGVGEFPNWDWLKGGWVWPAVTNENRDSMHVTRSGTFIPDVFLCTYEIIVSERVKTALSTLDGIDFNPIDFERLVDVAMPALGDFSYFDSDDLKQYGGQFDDYLKALPDIEALHEKVGDYYHLLGASQSDVVEEFRDRETVPVNYGSYHSTTSRIESVDVSVELLKKYPVVRCPPYVFREDAFSILAPFLDLDYFAISIGWRVGEQKGRFILGEDGLQWVPE